MIMNKLAMTVFSTGFLTAGCLSFSTANENFSPKTKIKKLTRVWSPSPRYSHTALWTSQGMMIWGGIPSYSDTKIKVTGGGVYRPASNTWRQIPPPNSEPMSLFHHTSVWSGEEALIFGGHDQIEDAPTDRGMAYNPETEQWRLFQPSPLTPSAREGHTSVWTGTEMIVWGGESGEDSLNNGSIYEPETDSWRPMNTEGAPSKRGFHTAVWTGEVMIVFGGFSNDNSLGDGGIYHPKQDVWLPFETDTTDSPSPRIGHSAVWTGKEMLVWGGSNGFGEYLGDGHAYNPKTNSWRTLSALKSPTPRELHSAIWTESSMVVLGGIGENGKAKSTGAIYNPELDKWSPFRVRKGHRSMHSAVWNGEKILVFGGRKTNQKFVKGKLKGFSIASDGFLKDKDDPSDEPVLEDIPSSPDTSGQGKTARRLLGH